MEKFASDSQGVKRGKCLNCEECSVFQWSPADGKLCCGYCECSPVKHKKVCAAELQTPLANESMVVEEEVALKAANVNPGSTTKGEGSNVTKGLSSHPIRLASKDPTSNLSNALNETVDLSHFIPENLLEQIEKIKTMDYKNIETNKCKIISSICKNLLNSNMASDCAILELSVLLTKKAPEFFRAPHGIPEHIHVLDRMKRSIKYLKQKKNDGLKNVPKKAEKKVCLPKAKETLNQTRRKRKSLTNTVKASEILEKFPELDCKEMMKWEFSILTNTKLSVMENNLKEAIPNIMEAMELKNSFLNQDGLCVLILLNLPKLVGKAHEKGRILRCFSKYLHNVHTDFTGAVLQLLQGYHVDKDWDPARRLRMAVSDGLSCCTFFLASKNLSIKFRRKEMCSYSIFQIKKYTLETREFRRHNKTIYFVIVEDVDVIFTGSTVGHAIGDPVMSAIDGGGYFSQRLQLYDDEVPSFNRNHYGRRTYLAPVTADVLWPANKENADNHKFLVPDLPLRFRRK